MEPISLAASPAARVTDWGAPTILLINVPAAETPAEHVRNALTLLGLIQQLSPAVWAYNPELGQAQRRAFAAVTVLEHGGPLRWAADHIRRAIEALLRVPLDWRIVDMLPAACGRLFVAWFALAARAEEN